MKLFFQRNKHFILLCGVFIIAEIIINPLGNFPLIDDWCFAQAVVTLYKSGVINFGDYPAMTLYTQIAWGFVATKVFGLTFFVLRCSSIVSAIIGFVFLNKLVLQISGSRQIAAITCLAVMFSPMVLCLTNTFMTDVNFNTLVIMCCFYMYNYFRTKNLLYYAAFVLSCILLVMLRQYGIVAPVCFIAASFFVERRLVRNLILAVIGFAIVFTLLKIYEDYLHTLLRSVASFKFSDNIHLSDQVFWDKLVASFDMRHKEIIRQMLLYALPLTLIFLPQLIRAAGAKVLLFAAAVSACFMYYLFFTESMTSLNVFSHMIVGPETFYESFHGSRHNVYAGFDNFMFYVKLISSGVTAVVLVAGFTLLLLEKKWRALFKPEVVFLIALVFSYAFMVLITESYFDRYHIPLMTLLLILTAYLARSYTVNIKLAVVPLLFWTYVSVAGTKDYMTLSRQKWTAFWYMHHDLKIPSDKINGGLEVNCWNDGESPGWRDFINLDNYDYLIQFDKEKGFAPVKEYEFQRYFPYKKDKIYIFVREDAKNKKL